MASEGRLQQNTGKSGMRQGIAQSVPPAENVTPQLFNLLNGLNNVIQPLFTLLQQILQVT